MNNVFKDSQVFKKRIISRKLYFGILSWAKKKRISQIKKFCLEYLLVWCCGLEIWSCWPFEKKKNTKSIFKLSILGQRPMHYNQRQFPTLTYYLNFFVNPAKKLNSLVSYSNKRLKKLVIDFAKVISRLFEYA